MRHTRDEALVVEINEYTAARRTCGLRDRGDELLSRALERMLRAENVLDNIRWGRDHLSRADREY